MKKINIKRLLLVISCAAILCASVATTLAWLSSEDEVQNQFAPGVVGCKINEEITNGAKTSIKVANSTIKQEGDTETANVDAYIRVALVPSWNYEADGSGSRYEAAAIELGTLGANWVKYGDYYYYTLPVAAGKLTGELLGEGVTIASPTQAPERGLIYNVEVLAQSVQADGGNAVGDAWGVTISQGSVAAYSSGN